jgi:hypothetical protein
VVIDADLVTSMFSTPTTTPRTFRNHASSNTKALGPCLASRRSKSYRVRLSEVESIILTLTERFFHCTATSSSRSNQKNMHPLLPFFANYDRTLSKSTVSRMFRKFVQLRVAEFPSALNPPGQTFSTTWPSFP